MNSYPENFKKLIESLEKLPSIGRKSAIRLAYFLAFEDKFSAINLAHNIEECVQDLQVCEECFGVSDSYICDICNDDSRNNGELCIVANAKDIFLLEDSGEFSGKYFVISDIKDTNIKQLEIKITNNNIKEIIFALTPSLGSDGIMLFLEDKLSHLGITFSKIAQGIPTGVSLENVDQLSLIRSLQARIKV
ncbi:MULTISPECIES: recombination mediator RecR [Helicobacter]|uniref:Recombination protein RecR n=1 Tax=Helicobacter ibis TaxID=2962633 RepID=A0ABT4VC72_9HELI|nr:MULTISPECIES: recombination mediator RecR [Helicobacter]MDA3967541.1 recombination mediator RecR [Helicobacter sp. WB40]MDA3968289.1 recombination mediator RecR [Helicobacter ibis]